MEKLTLDRKSYIPLYAQIKEHLLAIIRKRTERPGNTPGYQMIPSEDALTKLFSVSRMTVRQAISELVDEGYLERKQGVGTFISTGRISGQLDWIERFVDEWAVQGRDVRTTVTEYKIIPAPFEWASRLGLKKRDEILYIQRRRFAEGIPIALDSRFLPKEFAKIITIKDIEKESIFITLSKKGGLPIERADYEITAKVASSEEALALATKEGGPLLKRTLVIFALHQHPVITGVSLYHPDRFSYSLSVSAPPGA